MSSRITDAHFDADDREGHSQFLRKDINVLSEPWREVPRFRRPNIARVRYAS